MGEEPADVALAWLLHDPDVTAPIIGPRTKEQLTGISGPWRYLSRPTRIGGWTRSGPALAARRRGPMPGKPEGSTAAETEYENAPKPSQQGHSQDEVARVHSGEQRFAPPAGILAIL
jgi:hypothetical protein